MSKRIRLIPALCTLAVFTLVLTACGGDGETGQDTTPTPQPTATQAQGMTPQPTAAQQPTPTQGMDVAAHYQGQTVNVVVGFDAGGGYDVVSRIIAQHIQKYIPGEPRIQIVNEAGAGGLRGVQAPTREDADGLTIGVVHPRFLKQEVLGIDVEFFDPQEVLFIGSPTAAPSPNLTCVRKSIAASWEEVLQLSEPLTVGSTAAGESKGLGTAFIELIGGPFRNIYAYDGTSEVMNAFDRNELTATNRCSEEEVPRLYPQWLTDGILVPLFYFDAEPSQEYLDQMGWSEPVPDVLSLPGIDFTDEQRNVFNAALELDQYQRSWILHGDTPDAIYNAWQEAYEQLVEDQAFIDAMLTAGYVVGYAPPQDVQATMTSVGGLTEGGKELFRQLIGE